uniref:Uncharacterized protein n=1 Tax=Meloidogyne enterolobii TaxID=390850 RepID=A0A6V7WKT4_MELEN|nr:unnamed protein product [Meloidogyne enterolobii]
MWRIASLNELSIYLNRIMYVDRKDKCLLQQREEFKEIFKNTQNYFKIKNPSRDSTAIVAFAEHCCRFDNPDRLISTHETILKITGRSLQSHKYLSLNKAKDRVRSLFEFNKSVIERTNNYTKKLFR